MAHGDARKSAASRRNWSQRLAGKSPGGTLGKRGVIMGLPNPLSTQAQNRAWIQALTSLNMV
jgi:hypothetical protein